MSVLKVSLSCVTHKRGWSRWYLGIDVVNTGSTQSTVVV